MSIEAVTWIIVDVVVVVGLYGWAICRQIDKEKEEARSNEKMPNKD